MSIRNNVRKVSTRNASTSTTNTSLSSNNAQTGSRCYKHKPHIRAFLRSLLCGKPPRPVATGPLTTTTILRDKSHQTSSPGDVDNDTMLKWRYSPVNNNNNLVTVAEEQNEYDEINTEDLTSINHTRGDNVEQLRHANLRRISHTNVTPQVFSKDSDKHEVFSKSNAATKQSRSPSPDKDVDSAGLKDVIEIVNSLKTQFDTIKTQLDTSERCQQSLAREVGNLKVEKNALIKEMKQKHRHSLRRLAIANSSQQSSTDSQVYRLVDDSSMAYGSSRRQDGRRLTKSISSTLPTSVDVREGEEDLYNNSSDSDSGSSASYSPQHCAPQTFQTGRRSSSANRSDTFKHDRASMFNLYATCGSNTKHRRDAFLNAQRLRLVKRLIHSERKYCTGLWQLIENYSKLLYSTGAISRKDMSQIFPGHLTKFYEQHCAILRSLRRRVSNWSRYDLLGDLFHRFTRSTKANLFSIYKHYIAQFPNIVRAVNKLCCTSVLFRKVLDKSHKDGGAIGTSQALIGYLVMPIQRLPIYVTFLEELMSYTSDDHPDFDDLEMTFEAFKRFLRILNKSIENNLQIAGQPVYNSLISDDQCSSSSNNHSDHNSHKDSGVESYEDLVFHQHAERLHIFSKPEHKAHLNHAGRDHYESQPLQISHRADVKKQATLTSSRGHTHNKSGSRTALKRQPSFDDSDDGGDNYNVDDHDEVSGQKYGRREEDRKTLEHEKRVEEDKDSDDGGNQEEDVGEEDVGDEDADDDNDDDGQEDDENVLRGGALYRPQTPEPFRPSESDTSEDDSRPYNTVRKDSSQWSNNKQLYCRERTYSYVTRSTPDLTTNQDNMALARTRVRFRNPITEAMSCQPPQSVPSRSPARLERKKSLSDTLRVIFSRQKGNKTCQGIDPIDPEIRTTSKLVSDANTRNTSDDGTSYQSDTHKKSILRRKIGKELSTETNNNCVSRIYQ